MAELLRCRSNPRNIGRCAAKGIVRQSDGAKGAQFSAAEIGQAAGYSPNMGAGKGISEWIEYSKGGGGFSEVDGSSPQSLSSAANASDHS